MMLNSLRCRLARVIYPEAFVPPPPTSPAPVQIDEAREVESDPKTLVMLAEAYGGHMGLKLSTVSTYAAADGKWLKRLASGEAGCTLRKFNRVMTWFDQNWAQDLEWPRHIPRPSKSKKEAA